MKSFKKYTIIVLLILVAIVVAQNTEAVETKLLFATLEMPRALLLFVTLLIGVVIGLLLGAKVPGLGSKSGRPDERA